MLTRFRAQSFKSLESAELSLPRMLVLFGPNAAGKSNFLEALQCFSRLATERAVEDALAPPLRGYPVEAFRLPPGGLGELMSADKAAFELEGDVLPERRGDGGTSSRKLRYRVAVETRPSAGSFSVSDEYLAPLQMKKDEPFGRPIIEKEGGTFIVRVRGQGAHPTHEEPGKNHTIASVPAFTGKHYAYIDTLRAELGAWRSYYLDPRVAMRRACPPSEVTDIGPLGESIAPYLFRLKKEKLNCFAAARRALSMIIPSVQDMDVELNRERGEVEITIVQDGVRYPTRVISEGTLRVLALCSLCVNPWRPALVAFEEPENGVHPRRLDLIADMLVSLATEDGTQVVATTHSPRFCDAILKHQREMGDSIALVAVTRDGSETRFVPFDPAGPLFHQPDILRGLTSATEDGVFQAMMLRGLLDG